MEAPTQRNNFDTLRQVFAVLVVFSHSFPILRGTNATEPLFRLTGGVMTLGDVSVWSFFVISGFLITQSWQRSSSAWRYLKRRISRIYPGFLVVTLLCAFVVHPLATSPNQSSHISVWNYVSHTVRLKMFDQGQPFHSNPLPDSINGSLWSISYEFGCYLGLLLLGLAKLLRRDFLIGLTLAIMMAHLGLEVFDIRPDGKLLGLLLRASLLWATVLPFFLAGMLLHLFGRQRRLRGRYAAVACVLLIASVRIPYATVFTLPVLGSYLILWLAYLPALQPLNLGRWGDFSYGTYLYAFPVQQLLTYCFGSKLTPALLFSLAAPLSVALGVTSWHAVEKHFLSPKTILRLEESPALS